MLSSKPCCFLKVPQFSLKNGWYWILHILFVGGWSNKSCRYVAAFWKRNGQVCLTNKLSIIHEILFVKNRCHPNLVVFWKLRNLRSKMVDIEFSAYCILEDEAMKDVVLLLFFEKEMTKSVTQRKWASFMKFFLSNFVVI